MRITIHLPDSFQQDLQRMVGAEKRSVSSLVAEALTYYLRERKRRRHGRRVLELIGRSPVAPDALEALKAGRKDDRA